MNKRKEKKRKTKNEKPYNEKTLKKKFKSKASLACISCSSSDRLLLINIIINFFFARKELHIIYLYI